MRRRAGFTLIEVTIVVVVLSTLLSIAVPNFVSSRTRAKQTTCYSTLRQIEIAKEQWALEHNKPANAQPTQADLAPDYLKHWNTCPSGGSYTIGDLQTKPACSEHHFVP